VLSGDSATLLIQKETHYKAGSELRNDTVTGGTGLSYSISVWDQTIETLETGIQMEITPVISSDKKYVLLNIMVSLNDLLGFATETTTAFTAQGEVVSDTFQLPITEQTQVQTRVNIPDQGTVLLGGLTLAGENEVEAGVPALSKVPFLGRLFSNRSDVKDKQILLMLVKPTIVLKEEQEADAVAQLQQ
jgi:type II secretory pathway component GspD/PulD (secretin)